MIKEKKQNRNLPTLIRWSGRSSHSLALTHSRQRLRISQRFFFPPPDGVPWLSEKIPIILYVVAMLNLASFLTQVACAEPGHAGPAKKYYRPRTGQIQANRYPD